MAKTKTFDELMREYGNAKISGADLALGRENPDALAGIMEARRDWSNAETQEEKNAAHNRAENIRRAYGNYSGGADGMGGQYSPTYRKPEKTAQSDNVTALYEKYNNLYGKQNAPTWTPQYETQISELLDDIRSREAFQYDLDADPLYQQYREQYIREGRKAMENAAAQSAALTGGYGSTYGAIAAQQQYDNYLAGLNDKVPQLEQYAYEKYLNEGEALYDRLAAYQNEENRMYGQYLDALGQYNADRDYAFNSMQAAVGQNNYENEWNRSLYEADRAYEMNERELAVDLAMATGDYTALRNLGIDTGYLENQKAMETAYVQAKAAKASSGKGKEEEEYEAYADESVDSDTLNYLVELSTRTNGSEDFFNATVANMYSKGNLNDATYKKFLEIIGR